MKTKLFKLQAENKHLAAKGVEAKRTFKKVSTLQSEYNYLIQAHFKTRNDLKTL
jgi:tRNA(Met) C34 N-acetyltransferase TmcA